MVSASAAISGAIWKRIKPLKDVGDIQSASTKFNVQLAEFDKVEYNPTTPISKIMEFIDCLASQKKGNLDKDS